MPFRVLVVGPGALGRALGGVLERGGAEVSYLGRAGLIPSAHPERPSTQDALRASSAQDERAGRGAAAESKGPIDLGLVTVKAYDTAAAVRAALPHLGSAPVLTLQNGLGNVEAIAAAVGPERTLGGATTHAALREEGGRIRHMAFGETRIATLGKDAPPLARELAAALSAHGLETRAEGGLEALLWRKLAISCGVNPATALAGRPNGDLPAHAELFARAVAAAEEALALARDLGIAAPPPAEAESLLVEVCTRTARNRSSMLQDVLAGRRTEVGEINGAVVRLARERLSRAAPANQKFLEDLTFEPLTASIREKPAHA